MIEYWPWVAMVVGIFALFIYRFIYAPARFKLKVENEAKEVIREFRQNVAIRDSDIFGRKQPIDFYMRMNGIPKPKKGIEISIAGATIELMPIVISLLVLLSALYIILNSKTYADAHQKWAFGIVGTVLGYWLKR